MNECAVFACVCLSDERFAAMEFSSCRSSENFVHRTIFFISLAKMMPRQTVVDIINDYGFCSIEVEETILHASF